jgi:hypothetical protein
MFSLSLWLLPSVIVNSNGFQCTHSSLQCLTFFYRKCREKVSTVTCSEKGTIGGRQSNIFLCILHLLPLSLRSKKRFRAEGNINLSIIRFQFNVSRDERTFHKFFVPQGIALGEEWCMRGSPLIVSQSGL